MSYLLPDDLYGEYLGNRFQEDVDEAAAEEERRRAEEERESEREFQEFLAEQQQQIAEAEAEQARVYEEAAQFEAERQAREQEELAQAAWEDQQREEELAAFQEQEYNQLLDEAFGEYEAEQEQEPDYGIVDEAKFDSEEPWEAIGISTDFLEEKLGGDPVEIFDQQYEQEQLGQEPLEYLNEPEDPDTSFIDSVFSEWQPEQEPQQAEEPLDYMEYEGQRYPIMSQAGGDWGTDVNFGSQGVSPVEEPAYEPPPREVPPETPFVSPYEEILEEVTPEPLTPEPRPAGRDDFLPQPAATEPIGTAAGQVYEETGGPTQDPNKAIAFAQAQIGLPYSGPLSRIGGGRFGDPGYDCSSFVAAAFRELGINLTPFTDAAAGQTQRISNEQARPGDIIFYRYADPSQPGVTYPHMGIYMGNGQMIDAGFNTGVSMRPVLNLPYEIRRAPGVNPSAVAAAGVDQAQEVAQSSGGRPAGRDESSPSLGAVVPSSASPELVSYARQAAERAGIDQELFLRQITQESGWRTNVGSPAGAQGIAQIVPRFHPGVDTSDPLASLDYAANLMASHLRNYGGDYAKALAAYNAGVGAVAQYGGVPPFRETQSYVNIILGSGRPNLSELTPGAPSLYESPGVSGQSEGTGGGYAATARGQVYEPPADMFGAGNIFGAANPLLSGARDRVGDALGGIGGAIGQTFSDYGSAVRGEGRDPNEWAGALSSFDRNRPPVTGEPLRDYRGGEDRFDLFGALGNTAADALGQGQVDPFNLGGRLALTASNELGQGLQQLVGNAFGTAMQNDPYLARVREEQGPDAAWNAWWETYGSEMPQGLKGVIEQSPGLLAGMIGPGMVNNANRGVQAIGRGLEAVDIATAGPFAPLAALGYGNPSRQFDEIASALNPNQPFRSGLGPEVPMPEDSPSQIFLRQTSTTSSDDLLRGAGRQFGDFPEDMQDTLIRLQGQEPTSVRGTTYEEGNPLPPVNYQDVVNDVAKRRGLDPNDLAARFADPANRGEGVRELATMDLRLQEVGNEIAEIRARQASGVTEAADEFLLGEKNAEQLMLFNGIKGSGSEAGRTLNFLRMTYKLQRAEDESLQFTQAARVIKDTAKEVEAGLRNGYIKPETARKVEDIADFVERRLAGDDLPGTSLLDELSTGADEALAGATGGGVAAPPKMSVSDRARKKVVIEGDPELDKVLKQKAPAEFKSITDLNWRQKAEQEAGNTRGVNELEAERQDLLTKIKDKVYEEEIDKLYREYPSSTREDMVAMVDKQIIGRIRRNTSENVRGEPRFMGRMEQQLDQATSRALAKDEIATIEDDRIAGRITDEEADVRLRELSTRSGWHDDEVRKFDIQAGKKRERDVATAFLNTIKDMRAATGQMTFMEGGMRGQPVSSELEKMLQQMSTLSTQAEQMAKQYRTSIAKARARKFLGKGEAPPPELLQKLESIDIGNTREVNKLISDMNIPGKEPGKFTQLLNQLNSSRAASMLTGTAQLTNVFGNAVMAGYGVGRTGVAALGERIAPIAGRGQPRQAHFDQVGSMMAEMVAAVPPSLKDAADTWTTGVSSHEIRDLGHHRADPIDFTIPGTDKKLAGFSTGISLPGPIANIQIPTPKGVQQAMGPLTVGGAFKYANLNTVFRGLAATDDFTRSMNFNMALASEATRLAKQLSHDGRTVTEEELLLNLRHRPEMVKRARVEAERLTLQTPLEGWLIHANGLRKNPVGQFLLPFFNTLVNIQRIGLNMTPYGLINMKKAMDAGDFAEAANRRADMMIGTTLMGTGAVMAQANLITGAGPDNPQERQALMDTGWRPYSIQIAGNYFPLAVIGGALAVPLVLGALTKEMVDRGRADGKWENATAGLLRDYLSTMVDNSGLRTAGNLVALPYQPWRMESFIESQARSAVPYTGALGVLNRMFDPNIKDPEGAIEAIKSQLPYLRDQVPNRITRWGEEQNRSFSGPAALLPGSGSAAGPNSDIVVREISRLQSAGKNVLPRLQDGELKVPGRGDVDLTREQRNQLQTIAGVMAHKDLEVIMNQPSWSLKDADTQRGVINEVAGRAGNLARVTMAREQLGSTQPWKYRGVTDLQQEIDIDEAVRAVDAYMADRRRRPNEKVWVAQPSAEQMQLGRRYGNTNQQTAEYRRWRQEEERAGREQRAATQSNVEELLPYEIRQQNRRSAAATLQPVR